MIAPRSQPTFENLATQRIWTHDQALPSSVTLTLTTRRDCNYNRRSPCSYSLGETIPTTWDA
ncbi:MAG: hypothetical protein F6K50_20385 [Moorea sp. SIO3I7]|nr:hypothetical protein [Moorena sp. SIO3I7]NEO09315.1 hypothetical protein [Moorena sp. SIO3I8]